VRPAPFLLPLGPRTPHAAWRLRAGLAVYGALERSGPRVAGLAPPRRLDRRDAVRAEPLAADLVANGALSYGELAVDDAGLVRALARRAEAAGVHVVTGIVCEALLRDGARVVGVKARDVATGLPVCVRARVVVDATGPWSGRLGGAALSPLRLSRGTHITVPSARLPLSRTLVFFGPRDGRALFASPRGAHVLVGTTDVEHRGAPDDVAATREEIDYLLHALSVAVPRVRVGASDVISAFAGVRPLAAGDGDSGALDRDYVVSWDEPGLLALRGGKLTLALDGARRALRALGAEAARLGLPAIDVPAFGTLSPQPRPRALSPIADPVTWRAA
jgi:glycerol-3-phosphate dehydrogenase